MLKMSLGSLTGLAVLLLSFVTPASAAPDAFSVGSDLDGANNQFLFRIDLATGVATPIGDTGREIEALAFQPGTGILFGFDVDNEELVTIDTDTGAASLVGPAGMSADQDAGMTFDAAGRLWLSASNAADRLYELDPTTGAATLVGELAIHPTGLAAESDTVFGLNIRGNADQLITVDTDNAATTPVGPLVNVDLLGDDGGLAFDTTGTLWGIAQRAEPDNLGRTFTIDTDTGLATEVATTLAGFESLAIPPTPPAVAVPAMAPVGVVLTIAAFFMLLALLQRRSSAVGTSSS